MIEVAPRSGMKGLMSGSGLSAFALVSSADSRHTITDLVPASGKLYPIPESGYP
jgi:hypothetical protein